MSATAGAPAPSLSIVIAAYNASRTISPLLNACRAQDAAGPLEIIVVDDGSTDDTAAIAQKAGALVLRQANAGPAAARNRGWRAARSSVVLFTDSDCLPHSDWARRLSEGIDAPHSVACGSYGIANPESTLARTIHAEIRWRHARLPETVEFAGSYNLAATRAALESIGGFDERYRAPSAEDNDLSYRLRDAGHRIRFVAGALVDHHHTASLGKYLGEQARHGRWRVALYAAHPSRARGDGYAGGLDFAAPVAATLSGIALAVAPLVPSPRAALSAAGWLFAFVALVHIALAIRVSLAARARTPLLLAAVGTLRAYARAAGLVLGVFDLARGEARPT